MVFGCFPVCFSYGDGAFFVGFNRRAKSFSDNPALSFVSSIPLCMRYSPHFSVFQVVIHGLSICCICPFWQNCLNCLLLKTLPGSVLIDCAIPRSAKSFFRISITVLVVGFARSFASCQPE